MMTKPGIGVKRILIIVIILFTMIFLGCGCSQSDEEIGSDCQNGHGEGYISNNERNLPVIVYEKDGNIMISDKLDSPLKLTDGGKDEYPIISPDGNKIIFWRQAETGPLSLLRYDLWIIDSDGSNMSCLVSSGDLPGEAGFSTDAEEEVMLDRLPFQVRWTEDSRTVLFNTIIEWGYGLQTKNDLWLIDVNSPTPEQLIPDGEGGSFALSPDKKYLLVADSTSVSLIDYESLERRVTLEYPFVNTASEYEYIPQPVWSPDGSFGLIAISSPEPFQEKSSIKIWQIPLLGEPVLISDLPGMNLFNTMDDRLWSPDRKYIAYNDDNLIISSLDGEAITSFEDPSNFLNWSPDSFLFLFTRDNEIYMGDLDGKEEELILPGGIMPGWFDAKWLDNKTFMITAGNYYDGFALLYGNIDGRIVIVDRSVHSFDSIILP